MNANIYLKRRWKEDDAMKIASFLFTQGIGLYNVLGQKTLGSNARSSVQN